MKITLDLPSVAAGGAVALVLGLVAGFSPQATQVAPQRPATAVPLNGPQRPAARDLVFFRGGDPAYVVPPGRILVITSFERENSSRHALVINGVWTGIGDYNASDGNHQTTFADGGAGGVPISGGSSVEILTQSGTVGGTRTWFTGYLEDA